MPRKLCNLVTDVLTLGLSGFLRKKKRVAASKAAIESMMPGQPLVISGAPPKATTEPAQASDSLFNPIQMTAEAIRSGKYKLRTLYTIENIVIHRIQVGNIDDMMDFFSEYEGTGGKFPYHYIIMKSGTVYHTLPIDYVGPAAGVLNETGIQVALQGDFRKEEPTKEQYKQAQKLVVALNDACPRELKLLPHSPVFGEDGKQLKTSSDPHKECPGKLFDMRKVNSDA